MNPFEIAWSLLKGEYIHPSAMGHFARGRLLAEQGKEEGGGVSYRFAADRIADPPMELKPGKETDYPSKVPQNMRRGGPTFSRTDARNKQTKDDLAREKGFETYAQMMQQQRDKDHEEAMNIPQEKVNAFIHRLDNPVMRKPIFEGDRPYMSGHDELRNRAMRQTLVQRPSAYPRSMSYVDESGRTRYLDLPQDYYEEVQG
jgi:hypothetical protein